MMSEYFIGVDFGGTNVEIGLLGRDGEMVTRLTVPSQIELGPLLLVERLAQACRKLIDQSQIPFDQIKALGIGSPGPLSVAQGKIIKAGNLPGFDNFHLRGELSQRLQIPGVLENDANAACWGEFWLGAGKDVTDMVMFTLGTGIGGGIICDGELIHGSDDNAAELGHMLIQINGRECTCGQRGCLEAYTSANNTAARADEALDQGRSSEMLQTRRQNGKLTSKDVFDHAIAGDALANEIIDGTTQALALACVNMRHITEPQMIVFAGGMIQAGDILISRVRRFYEEMIWHLKPEPMQICLARLGQDAGFIGSAGRALHAYQHQRLYPVGT